MRHRVNRETGSLIAEAGAAFAFLFPLLVVVLYVTLEASYAYTIKSTLDQASRQACRDLAIAYGQNPAIATNRGLQDSQVFDRIRVNNIINNSQQFNNPAWNT